MGMLEKKLELDILRNGRVMMISKVQVKSGLVNLIKTCQVNLDQAELKTEKNQVKLGKVKSDGSSRKSFGPKICWF